VAVKLRVRLETRKEELFVVFHLTSGWWKSRLQVPLEKVKEIFSI
jgi:hypothetical protein